MLPSLLLRVVVDAYIQRLEEHKRIVRKRVREREREKKKVKERERKKEMVVRVEFHLVQWSNTP